MKHLLLTTTAAMLATTAVSASDVQLDITSAGGSAVNAIVGAQVNYEVRVELSDANNEGLALLCFDLEFDGGALSQANAASGASQLNFATPLGLSNPSGFGGTPSLGKLLQVGGAQNTIKNFFAAVPTGSVITDLGKPGSPFLFASGSLTAPATAGVYHLSATNVIANVIRPGETNLNVFWAVDKAGVGALNGLTIHVFDCAPVVYCAAKVNSQSCTPGIASSGTPTLSGADDFHLTASNIINQKMGLMFWGVGADNSPFQGGTMCVQGPFHRTVTQFSGGSVAGNDCTGTYDFHFSQAFMQAEGFSPGSQINAQYWYRDRAHADGTGIGLTNAVEFTVCP